MAWIWLGIAGLLEIGLKASDGFTRPAITAATVASMVASLIFLGLALRALPVGTGYAVWTGIGTVGTAVLGMVLFGEPAGVARLVCIALIVLGIAGLKLTA